MDSDHVQRNLLSGHGLSAGNDQADHPSEESYPDNDCSPLYRYLDAWLDQFPYYICDSLLDKFIRMLESDWDPRKEQPRCWPSGMRYRTVKKLKKQGMLDFSVNEYRQTDGELVKIQFIRGLLCGELLKVVTVQELKKAMYDATDQYDSAERPWIISRILEGFETFKSHHEQGQLISTYPLDFMLMLVRRRRPPR